MGHRLDRIKRSLNRFSHGDENYIPFAPDMPRDIPQRNTWDQTAKLSALSGLAVGIGSNSAEEGAVAAAATGFAHRVATNAAWDEYYKMCAEADEKNRRGSHSQY